MASPFRIRTTVAQRRRFLAPVMRVASRGVRALQRCSCRCYWSSSRSASRCDLRWCSEWVCPACSSTPHSVSSLLGPVRVEALVVELQPIRAWEAITVGVMHLAPPSRWPAQRAGTAPTDERQKPSWARESRSSLSSTRLDLSSASCRGYEQSERAADVHSSASGLVRASFSRSPRTAATRRMR
ncbi:hypothetical protein N658DRAFT_154971 [Parathielavia hyrcaniae]|uniref:Uncharacterized protein n=1 Tax=Parathielavia hyrcaniae TaxID=113614 RepID=A0AAN6PXL0_9PEZI|nr:hypothetical protein N658DRAFT_154971 [Parathielavia hyrcaniae]